MQLADSVVIFLDCGCGTEVKSVTDDCVLPMAQRSRRKTGGGELEIFLGHSFHAIITVILMVRHSLDLSSHCPEPFHSGS